MSRRRGTNNWVADLLRGQTSSSNSGGGPGFGAGIFQGLPASANLDNIGSPVPSWIANLVGKGTPPKDYNGPGFGAGIFEGVPKAVSGVTDWAKSLGAAPDIMGGTHHPTGNSRKDLMAAARNAITSQYGPALGVLADAIGDTRRQGQRQKHQIKRQGNRAEGDLAVLYNRLKQATGTIQRAQNADYRQTRKQTRSDYHDLLAGQRQDFQEGAGGVADELKRMGLDPSTALAGAAQDRAFNKTFAKEDRNNSLGNQRQSRNDYNSIMGQMKDDVIATGNAAIGNQEGLTRTQLQDAAAQVADRMFQLRMQQAQLEGQQSSALAQAKLQASQQGAGGMSPMDKLDYQLKKVELAKALGVIPPEADPSAAAPNGVGDAMQFLNDNSGDSAGTLGFLINQAMMGHPDPFTKGPMKGDNFQWQSEDYPQILSWLLSNARTRGLNSSQDAQSAQTALQIALGMYG